MSRWISIALMLAIASPTLLAARHPKDQPPKEPPQAAQAKEESALVKVVTAPKQTKLQNEPAWVLHVSSVTGAGSIEMFATAAGAGTVIEAAKPGDILDVTVAVEHNKKIIRSATPYEPKPGEAEPNVYVFGRTSPQKVGSKELPGIEVTKFKVAKVFLLPTSRGADNKPAVTPEVAKVVDSLKEGDSVLILSAGGSPAMARSIYPYEAPKEGQFVKFAPKGADHDASVELKDDAGQSQTLLIPAKEAPALLAKVANLRAGATVSYSSTSDDKGKWLIDIKAGPLPKTAKPAEKPAAGEPAPKPADKPAAE